MKTIAAWRLGLAWALAVPLPAAAQQVDVRDFVRQAFVHGVPYEEASSYGALVVPTLLAMLEDPAEQEYWTNIVGVLGMIGDDRAVEPLIAFAASRTAETLSPAQYRAKSSVPLALGYLVNKAGNQRALSYLIQGLNPAVWSQRGVTWRSPYHATDLERGLQLTTSAVLGLAVSGSPAAAQALRALQGDTSTTGKQLQAQVGPVVSDALQTHAQIVRVGLVEYYRTRRQD